MENLLFVFQNIHHWASIVLIQHTSALDCTNLHETCSYLPKHALRMVQTLLQAFKTVVCVFLKYGNKKKSVEHGHLRPLSDPLQPHNLMNLKYKPFTIKREI